MRSLIVLLIGLSSVTGFAQFRENEWDQESNDRALLIQVYKTKIGQGLSFDKQDIEKLLGDAGSPESPLKDVLVPYLNEITNPAKRASYIKFLDTVFAEVETYLLNGSKADMRGLDESVEVLNEKSELILKYQEAERSFVSLLNSYSEYKTRDVSNNKKEYYEDGKTLQKETYVEYSSGATFIKEYFPSGKPLKISKYERRSGDQFAYIIEYYESGSVSKTYAYKNGRSHSKWLEYFEDGSTKREENFKDGKPEGFSILYRQDGSVMWEMEHSEGLPREIRKFNQDNKIDYHAYYENGKLLRSEKYEYDASGDFNGVTVMDKEGRSIKYGKDYQIKSIMTYQPSWTPEAVNSRLNYYSKNPITQNDLTELLTQGLIRHLIDNARTEKDVERIKLLIDDILKSEILLSGMQKQSIAILQQKLASVTGAIYDRELLFSESDARAKLLGFVGETDLSGEELTERAIEKFVDVCQTNDGTLTPEALSILSRTDVLEYMTHYSKSNVSMAYVVSEMKTYFSLKPTEGKLDFYRNDALFRLKLNAYDYVNSIKMLRK